MQHTYLTTAMYYFVSLPHFKTLREPLLNFCISKNIKGTLLLADEGINGTLAGSEKSPIVYSYKKNEELKILISDAKQEYFLIKNKDGLSGWIKIPLGQRPTIFKEIFYAGD